MRKHPLPSGLYDFSQAGPLRSPAEDFCCLLRISRQFRSIACPSRLYRESDRLPRYLAAGRDYVEHTVSCAVCQIVAFGVGHLLCQQASRGQQVGVTQV